MDPMFKKLNDYYGPPAVLSGEFYYPNMCHVCYVFGEKANLKRCGACGMISYCCQEHQVKDWPNHKSFCKIISQVRKKWKVFKPLKNIASKMSSPGVCKTLEDLKSLVSLNSYLIMSVMKLLKRELTTIEQQMIHFPRVCAVCFESEPDLLTNCQKCPQASFCKEHLNDPSHDSECPKIMQTYYYTVKKDTLLRSFSLLSNILERRDYMANWEPEVKTLPTSMLQFIETQFLSNFPKWGISFGFTDEMRSIFTAILSERFSRQFTLIFAIKKLGLNLGSMVIHVVGATNLEQLITDWEVVFHYLPVLRLLRLVLIGPELITDLVDSGSITQVCKDCAKKGRRLIIEMKKDLYHEYCRGNDFLPPDLIVCFNAGFHVFETWDKTISIFNKGECPLIVTAVHATEGAIGKELLDKTFPSAKCIFNGSNPFPLMNYERECIFLPLAAKNQFMFIYEFLGNNSTK